MTDFFSNFGKYATACLYSRRWRLRDAAVRVITQFFDTMFKHAIPVNAANAMLNYLDSKGYGLLDTIQTAFISACEFLTRLVDDKLGGVELASVQPHVQSLMPRLFLRAADTTTKTREEALCTIFVLANSPIGPERVAAAALADPLDQDKRRMPTQNHRTYLCRLLVMQQLLNNHGLSRTISVDALMSKLLLLCLNHQNNEVRDLAVVVAGCIDSSKGQDIMRHLPSIRNPATRAVIEERLAFPGKDGDSDAADASADEGGKTPNHKSPEARGGKPPVRGKSAKRRQQGNAASA
jgi:centrosomal protein CEP104